MISQDSKNGITFSKFKIFGAGGGSFQHSYTVKFMA